MRSIPIGKRQASRLFVIIETVKTTNEDYTMIHRHFGAFAVVAIGFATATPGTARSDSHTISAPIVAPIARQSVPALKLAMGPTSAPQKPGGAGEAPADTQPHKTTKHKHKHS